jgi:tape measure domain-containing protein
VQKPIPEAMDISDTYTNTNSKLSMITNSLAEQQALQQEIFSAADRARGSYSTMADTVAKLGITSGEQFGNTDNIVKFTETMQKMFKVGGTSTANQSGAMLQLQQAIGLGKLQGQDLRILVEDAPLVEKAIAQYMGKSTGEIKSLGTAGKITSQTLINSILAYSSTIDSQMGKMSYTWGDYWNKIKNGATKAFGSVFGDESKILGSQGFQTFINGIVNGFYGLAQVAGNVLSVVSNIGNFFAQNWSVIAPIIGAIVAALVILTVTTRIYAFAQAVVAATNPFTLILLAIVAIISVYVILVAAIGKGTGQSLNALGILCGALNVVKEFFVNLVFAAADAFLALWEGGSAAARNLIVAFKNAWIDIQAGFFAFLSVVLTGISKIAGALNMIPGVSIDTSGLESAINANASKAASLYASKQGYEDVNAATAQGRSTYSVFKDNWVSDAFNSGNQWGTGVSNMLSSIGAGIGTGGTDTLGTASNPTTVTGTGSNGNVTVNIADQDLQYLRDLAEKDYVAKFSNSTLAPNITVHIDSSGNASTDKQLSSRISAILQEQISTSSEGTHA